MSHPAKRLWLVEDVLDRVVVPDPDTVLREDVDVEETILVVFLVDLPDASDRVISDAGKLVRMTNHWKIRTWRGQIVVF